MLLELISSWIWIAHLYGSCFIYLFYLAQVNNGNREVLYLLNWQQTIITLTKHQLQGEEIL